MKDPAFLFYSQDFLTGTYTMSDEQVGKYIRLICLQHAKGRLSENDMLKICKTYDAEIYEKFEENEGYFINQRLDFEIQRRKKYAESRANNRKSSKSQQVKPKKDMKNICKTYDSHMENENENENINRNYIKKYDEIKKTREFSKEWEEVILRWLKYKAEIKNSYKTKDSLTAAINQLVEMARDNPETGKKIVLQSIANGWKGLFELKNIKNGKTREEQLNEARERLFRKVRAESERLNKAEVPDS